VAAGSAILRTSAPSTLTRCGAGLVLRTCESAALRLEHLLFAPDCARPLLLGCATLENLGDDVLVVRHAELWDVPCTDALGEDGACSGRAPRGVRVLAELDPVIRARVPEPLERGLALDVRFAIPARASRRLCFGYGLPGEEDDPAALVRGWRGSVPDELERTLSRWRTCLADSHDPLSLYRSSVLGAARLGGPGHGRP
jgi:hypothetical protein